MKLRNKLCIASAAAAVGFISASATVAAPTAPHTAVQHMRCVGVHPDTATDAPTPNSTHSVAHSSSTATL